MEFNGHWEIDPRRLDEYDKENIAKQQIAIRLASDIFRYVEISKIDGDFASEKIDSAVKTEIFETSFHVIKKEQMLTIRRTIYMLHAQRDITEETYQLLIRLLTD